MAQYATYSIFGDVSDIDNYIFQSTFKNIQVLKKYV